jgi:thioredoxin-like negative regulator of GroEL
LPAGPDALHARFGTRVAGALNERAALLPHEVAERLRVAREGALDRARRTRATASAGAAAPLVPVGAARGAAAVLGGDPGRAGARWWQRALSAMPVLALLAGLWAIDHFQALEQVRDAADIDARLLADDLPPQAYSDPGFVEFLKSDLAP